MFNYKAFQNLNGTDLKNVRLSLSLNLKQNARSNDMKLITFPARTDVFKFSCFPRIIPTWNSLPQEIVHAVRPASFSAKV